MTPTRRQIGTFYRAHFSESQRAPKTPVYLKHGCVRNAAQQGVEVGFIERHYSRDVYDRISRRPRDRGREEDIARHSCERCVGRNHGYENRGQAAGVMRVRLNNEDRPSFGRSAAHGMTEVGRTNATTLDYQPSSPSDSNARPAAAATAPESSQFRSLRASSI